MGSRPVFLLSDFGAGSNYVGIMRAVIASSDASIPIHDLTHDVNPGSIREAGYLLGAAWPYLPKESVVLCIVDPGVGSSRGILMVRFGHRLLMAPDNGLLTGLLENETPADLYRVRDEVIEEFKPSRTFHGRDLFAPIGAELAISGDFTKRGEPIAQGKLLPGWRAAAIPDGFMLEIVHVDRFGNLITNLEMVHLIEAKVLKLAGAKVSQVAVARTYSEVEPGESLAYMGSSGRLEFGVRDGRADLAFGLELGAQVRLLLG
jgi:S-adenosylmethionine hydrolase